MTDLVESKFTSFKNTPIINKLKSFIMESDIKNLFHINVYKLADEWGISRRELLEIFIRTVNFGIFDIQWDFHCPRCGGIALESLNLIDTKSEDYCPVCEKDFFNTLDDNIEVFFNINESLKIIPEEIKKSFMDHITDTITKNRIYHWKSPTTISGLDCINNNVFREIFGNETLPVDQSLAIKYATILFTDIKGSTAMYERLGDAKAYTLVREHFEIIFNNIQHHNGVPIKTIGDAVMGVFNSETDALDAAFQSQKALKSFYSNKDEKIEVKIGLHSGSVLVVTLNNTLDYFGSTVNTAARIQSLSQPNQITFSELVYANNKKKIASYVKKLQRSRNNLKGLSEDFTIYHAL